MMPLSKKRNKERMKRIRLHVKNHTEGVQPKRVITAQEGKAYKQPIDADGNIIWED